MARLNKPDPVMRPVERAEDPVDAVTGVSEYVANIPLLQALNEKVADCLGHGTAPELQGIKAYLLSGVPIGRINTISP
jgi:hypothetical protein